MKKLSPSVSEIRAKIAALADPEMASHSLRFFRTGPGEYGEGDRFLGIRVPVLRRVAKEHLGISLPMVKSFLRSKFHEERLFGLIVLTMQYRNGSREDRQSIFDLYCREMHCINNWDLVDTSAHLIIGEHLRNRDRSLLFQLAKSSILWERRIAMISTLAYIRVDDFDDALQIAEILIEDKEDLIHKAVGWMLREIGKRHFQVEEAFLNKHHKKMPRTMLRYAIEKFPDAERRRLMDKSQP